MGETIAPKIRKIERGIQEAILPGAETEEKRKQQQESVLGRKTGAVTNKFLEAQ